jgi:hypothetical protein
LRTILLTSPEELADHGEQWEALRRSVGANVYNSNHLSRLWLETFKDSASPSVVMVEDHGELVAIAPLATSILKVKGLSLKTVALIGGIPQSLRLVTNSVMLQPGRRDALEVMIKEIKRLNWSVLWTENMDDSPAVQEYISAARSAWFATVQTPNKNVTIDVGETGDITKGFASHGQRTLKKALNKIEREGHVGKFRQVPSDGIDAAVEVYARQHIERWRTKGGSPFLDPKNVEFLKRMIGVGYQEDFGIIYEYTIDEEVAAQLMGFIEGDHAFMYRLGMNNVYESFSPGWLIHNHALPNLRDKGVRRCTVGGGGQQYKYEMGGQESLLVGLQATKGVASVMMRLLRSRPMQRIDSKLGITKKALNTLSVESTE